MKEGPPDSREPARPHLIEGVQPIMTCIGTPEDFDDFESLIAGPNTFVDYFGVSEELRQDGIKFDESKTYLISPVDTTDKLSKNYQDCTGLVAVGRESKTGENISMLTHQDENVLHKDRSSPSFRAHMIAGLNELKNRSAGGTVDIIIFSGSRPPGNGSTDVPYDRFITILSGIVKEIFGFEPTVISGPKTAITNEGEDNAFFDTKNRRLFLERYENSNQSHLNDATAHSYLPRDIAQESKKWK